MTTRPVTVLLSVSTGVCQRLPAATLRHPAGAPPGRRRRAPEALAMHKLAIAGPANGPAAAALARARLRPPSA